MVTLENDFLLVTIKEDGAEMTRLFNKKRSMEMLWYGDKRYWGRQAPVLFPFVGKVSDGHFKVDGKHYDMGQHGFARDMVFKQTKMNATSATFTLAATEETLKRYPFNFVLEITYTLEKDMVLIAYKVTNEDNKPMTFCIGAHPAFMCPMLKEERMEDYDFVFEKTETAAIFPLSEEGMLKRDVVPYLENENVIPLKKGLFDDDALVFGNLTSNWVQCINKKSGNGIEVGFEGFPFLGLWQPTGGAPFVCIEPWFGHADFVGYDGELRDKEDQVTLASEGVFECMHYMRPLS